MKAGSVGSTPNGATNISTRPSQPLSNLLDEIGEAVANLNTIVVGLDAVESGYQKPDKLNISWNPLDRKLASRKSRKFSLESVLVRVGESVGQFIAALSKLQRFEPTKEKWNGDTQLSIKLRDIAEEALGQKSYLVPAAMLLIHWRNRVVHTNSKAKLTAAEKVLLRSAETEIAEKFSDLSIDRTLTHFEEQRPTLKDISSLISMTIRLARQIDKQVFDKLSREDLDALISFYEIDSTLRKVISETHSDKLSASIRRVFKSMAPQLLNAYVEHYGPFDATQTASTTPST